MYLAAIVKDMVVADTFPSCCTVRAVELAFGGVKHSGSPAATSCDPAMPGMNAMVWSTLVVLWMWFNRGTAAARSWPIVKAMVTKRGEP